MNNHEPNDKGILVSVVSIAYNHEPYIRQCLEGFVMQKTNFAFEVLIHDDASTDKTADIIREYEIKYPNIIKPIYQKENQYSKGISIGKTYLYPRVRGKYIAECEGDDYWTDPLKLQKQADFLENHPDYSMCFHNAIKNDLFNNTQTLFNKKLNKSTFKVKDVILKSWFTPTASFFFRSEDFTMPMWKDVNGDMTLLYLNATKGKIYYMDELMSVYNYGTPSSLSQNTIKRPFFLYKKKTRLLRCFDEYTNYKYILYTSLKRVKTIAGLLLRYIR